MTAAVPASEHPAAGLDWGRAARELDECGCTILEHLLSPAQCRALTELYPDESRIRSRVVMARHGFGRGEYQYFRYPLPGPIAALRLAVYPRLAPICPGSG